MLDTPNAVLASVGHTLAMKTTRRAVQWLFCTEYSNSGIQAIGEMARKTCIYGFTALNSTWLRPRITPRVIATTEPDTNPAVKRETLNNVSVPIPLSLGPSS